MKFQLSAPTGRARSYRKETPVEGATITIFRDKKTCDVFLKFQVSGPPAMLPHSRRKLYLISGGITYAEGVIAGSPGLQCEASYPGFKSPLLLRCKRCCNSFPVGNNPFGVACLFGTTLTQGSSLRIATLGYPQ